MVKKVIKIYFSSSWVEDLKYLIKSNFKNLMNLFSLYYSNHLRQFKE